MRQLKYRGRLLDKKEGLSLRKGDWVYGSPEEGLDDRYFIHSMVHVFEIDPETLQQSTEVYSTDQARLLFEGDTVEILGDSRWRNIYGDEHVRGKIKFEHGAFIVKDSSNSTHHLDNLEEIVWISDR